MTSIWQWSIVTSARTARRAANLARQRNAFLNYRTYAVGKERTFFFIRFGGFAAKTNEIKVSFYFGSKIAKIISEETILVKRGNMPALIMYPGVIYGPLRSRRLGLSLGVNLLPVGRKVCSFNCVYCECGDTTELIDQSRDEQGRRTTFPPVEKVRQEVAAALREYPNLDAITFAGHGEPTLHPRWPEVVEAVRELRDQLQPQAKVGVLTSAALVNRPRPRAGIDRCDLRMMKLDAGDDATFQAIDRPADNVDLETIISELARMPDILVQTCLIDGPVQNIQGSPWEALVTAIGRIRPTLVQLYPVDRPTPELWVRKVPHDVVLERAAELQARTGVPAEAFA